MSTDLTPFTNDEFALAIEMHEVDGFRIQAPGFARALGFRDAFRLLESIPDDEKGYTTACTPGGEQRMGYLTEAGFYRALGQRQAARITDPELRARVERFQSWVYGTVLPQIRRTGSYGSATEVRPLTGLEYARRLVDAEERAEAGAKFQRAIEAGDGLTLTTFHKKYFSAVREIDFFTHLYTRKWLINQLGKGSIRTCGPKAGTRRDGSEHRHPTFKGKPYMYLHGAKDNTDRRRENTRVRPGSHELQLRDRLVAEGLSANENTAGLFELEGAK